MIILIYGQDYVHTGMYLADTRKWFAEVTIGPTTGFPCSFELPIWEGQEGGKRRRRLPNQNWFRHVCASYKLIQSTKKALVAFVRGGTADCVQPANCRQVQLSDTRPTSNKAKIAQLPKNRCNKTLTCFFCVTPPTDSLRTCDEKRSVSDATNRRLPTQVNSDDRRERLPEIGQRREALTKTIVQICIVNDELIYPFTLQSV